MTAKESNPTAHLLAAQARLEQLRAQVRARQTDSGATAHPCSQGEAAGSPPWSETPAEAEPRANRPVRLTPAEWGQKALEQRRRQEALAQGERASDALKAALATPQGKRRPVKQRLPRPGPAPGNSRREEETPAAEAVKIYPSIVLGMLTAKLEAAGRIWLLLQYLDPQGRGWLELEEVRRKLTGKKSPLRIYSWRRLRQLFDQGEGIFWTRDDRERIWLRGATKVAAALEVERLSGRPVDLPIPVLLGGIQRVRAHFYASYHSGRRDNNPISRQTLRVLTGVPERTQYEYEQTAGVSSRHNIAVGEQYSTENAQERAWQHGRASFQFIDTEGKQGGRPNREYVAWHLPNSYEGPHCQRSKGRQKKINRKLADLVTKLAQGNGRGQVERIFYPHGAAAGKAYNRSPRTDTYWPGGKTRSEQVGLWYVLAGKDG